MDKLPALEDIKVFVTAARVMSFARAAEQLMVSPAYISKRIKLLEENLGFTLFYRSARSINLTLEGEIVLRTGTQMLQDLDGMMDELLACRQETRGLLRISCSTGFGTEFLNPFILSLRDRYPLLGIDLRLVDRSVDIVTENVDLDICLGGNIPEQFIARKLAPNYRVFCASPHYLEKHGCPLHPRDLEHAHACISIRERNHSPASWKIERGQERLTVIPNSQLSVNNGNVAKEWCLKGEGILLRSIWSIRKELAEGKLIQVLPEWQQPADVFAVYTRQMGTSANLKVFIEQLELYLKQQMA
ncbi:LysR substrate-binding domain-containing protein [Marinobacterium sediminicola]|uniref:LysR substrate-binding domain-containing protein n=1 Tax=Marinobacterium sediminicola TaxID=518898 RepID=UPI001EF05B50|nr:LysR substrate-binding domain-containing protein [Marinobacterium sediminicola]ULG68026.1 LysR substrate-binding domain-containing protein [Marinobacterium sediminicola]